MKELTLKTSHILLLFFGIYFLYSCSSKYEIETIELTRTSWEEVEINEIYKVDGFNPFITKTPKPGRISITILNESGIEIASSSSREVSIPDKSLKSNELLTLNLETRINNQILSQSTILRASPKKVEFKPQWDISSGYSYFINTIEAQEVRKTYGSYGNYEVIHNLPLSGTVKVSLDGRFGDTQTFNITEPYPDFSVQFLNNLRKQIFLNHDAKIQVQYSILWKGESINSPYYSKSIDLSPSFSDGDDGYYWSFDLAPYEAKFYKYYVYSGDFGVFTLKNIGYKSDLDVYVYDDSNLTNLTTSSEKGGTQNDLCFVENSGYYYVKVWNNGALPTKGKLTTHSVDLEDVAISTMSDYLAQNFLKFLIKELFGVEDNDEVGDHLSDLAANISLSALKGNNSSTLTENALANELCLAFKATANNREEANLLCTFAINVAKEVYKYN